ncbi:Hypothetical protein CINCED_3A010132, partial [Cinara cedri]
MERWCQISISEDRTAFQRAHMQLLRTELSRKEDRNDNWFIKLINGWLICPEFQKKIDFKAPSLNLRNNPPFSIPHCSGKLIASSPEYRLLIN